ncbi:MAG: HIT domain-containing protein [Bacteroidetes bacterium]|nr:HIT domain-containing protein [Bacteroidota bacterium]
MAKHLFSPWRSEYIEEFNKPKSKKCLFCTLASDKLEDRKNLVIYRGEHCYVVMNKFPYNSGHLMIVPYKHTAKLTKLTENEFTEIMNLTVRCSEALTTLYKPHGFNFGANIGRVAGAGIEKHIHFHLVPRWNGDVNFMPVLSDVKVVSQSIQKIADSLQKVLCNTKGTV